MATLVVYPTDFIQGTVTPPSSKSHSIRALFLALLCHGASRIRGCLQSGDTQQAQQLCQALGATIQHHEQTVIVQSEGIPLLGSPPHLEVGCSGLSACLVMPLLGLKQSFAQPTILQGSEQMRQRPIKPLIDALCQLGLTIKALINLDQLPLAITGRLIGGKVHVDGSISQYLSALLLALPCATGESEIIVCHLKERPYVEMTLAWLRAQQIRFAHQRLVKADHFFIPGGQVYRPFECTIPADFSSAAYLIAAATLLDSKVTISGLNWEDQQGDKQLVTLLKTMGATMTMTPSTLVIQGSRQSLRGIAIDASDIPDLLPILAVIATQARGKTIITHVAQARQKETDRLHSMVAGLSRMGAIIRETHEGLCIEGHPLQGAAVRGYGDHRTVMALSIAGLVAKGVTTIDDYEAVYKTFPTFLPTMRALGARMVKKAERIYPSPFKMPTLLLP